MRSMKSVQRSLSRFRKASPATQEARRERIFQKDLVDWAAKIKKKPFNGPTVMYEYKRPSSIDYKVSAVTKKGLDYAKSHPLRPLDNGGRPFLVDLQKDHINVYLRRLPKPTRSGEEDYEQGFWMERKEEFRKFSDCILFMSVPMKPSDTVFIGESDYFNFDYFFGKFEPGFVGCSVLIQRNLGPQKFELTLVASGIERSIVNEPVLKFVASVGNSGVPYGYAQTENLLINFQPIGCNESATYKLSTTVALDDGEKSCMPNSGFNRVNEAAKRKEYHYKVLKKQVILPRFFG